MAIAKVLYLSNASNLSGATRALLEIMDEMKLRGIEPVAIIAGNGKLGDELQKRGIRYYRLHYYSWLRKVREERDLKDCIRWQIKQTLSWAAEKAVYRILKKEMPDIVHINTGISPVGLKSAKVLGIPLVWHIRELPLQYFNQLPFDEQYETDCLKKADSVLAISKYIYNNYAHKSPANMQVIYDGVETRGYEKLRTYPPFARSQIRLSLCGYNEMKGHAEGIRAMAILKDRGYTHAHLSLWGNVVPLYREELMRLVKELNVQDMVTFEGFTRQMAMEWANSDIALMCSAAEGFGRVTVEAMASGALVIGANAGATPEILEDGVGLLYEKFNAEDLANKIEYALNNMEEARQIAAKGQQHILSGVYSMEKNISALLNLYQSLAVKEN